MRAVYHAYNDREGVTHAFTMNGLEHANELLGYEAFKLDEWKAEGEYDQVCERHRAFVVPQKDIQVEGIDLKQGEKVRIEESYKYNHDQAVNLFTEAGVIEGARWVNDVGSYGEHSFLPFITDLGLEPGEIAQPYTHDRCFNTFSSFAHVV